MPTTWRAKSTTAICLALTLAEIGSRVLLIDADLRRPSVAAMTGVEVAVGLTTVLVGDATLEDAPLQVTVLNFTGERIEGTVRSDAFTPRMAVVDARDGGEIGWVDDLHSFGVWLSPYSGLFLLLQPGTREDVAG